MPPEPGAPQGRSPRQQSASWAAASPTSGPAGQGREPPPPTAGGQGAALTPLGVEELGTPSRTPPLSQGVGRNKESGCAVPSAVLRIQEPCHLAETQALPHPASARTWPASPTACAAGRRLLPLRTPRPLAQGSSEIPSSCQQPSRTQHHGDSATWGSVWPPAPPTHPHLQKYCLREEGTQASAPWGLSSCLSQQPHPQTL